MSSCASAEQMGRPVVVSVLGSTATGKSALSLAIADSFGGEIVNCDSTAVYRGFDIGTDKVPASVRRGIPHHLIDIRNPDEPCTAGDYSREARAAIAEIEARGHLPIVSGGTGLYLRALTDGLFAGPQRDEELRERDMSWEAIEHSTPPYTALVPGGAGSG